MNTRMALILFLSLGFGFGIANSEPLYVSLNRENGVHSRALFNDLKSCHISLKQDNKSASAQAMADDIDFLISKSVTISSPGLMGKSANYIELLKNYENYISIVSVSIYSKIAVQLEAVHRKYARLCRDHSSFRVGFSKVDQLYESMLSIVSSSAKSTQALLALNLLDGLDASSIDRVYSFLWSLVPADLAKDFDPRNQEAQKNIVVNLFRKPIVVWSLKTFFQLDSKKRVALFNDLFSFMRPYQVLYETTAENNEIYPFLPTLSSGFHRHKNWSCLKDVANDLSLIKVRSNEIVTFDLINKFIESRCPFLEKEERIAMLNQHDRFRSWRVALSTRNYINSQVAPEISTVSESESVVVRYLPLLEFNDLFFKYLRGTRFHHYSTAVMSSCHLKRKFGYSNNEIIAMTVMASLTYQILDIVPKLKSMNVKWQEIVEDSSSDIDMWNAGARYCL